MSLFKMEKHFKFIISTVLMMGPVGSSYADFGFIQDKDGVCECKGKFKFNF